MQKSGNHHPIHPKQGLASIPRSKDQGFTLDLVTLLLPSIPKAKGRALLQAIQRTEVKAVLDELDDRFAADTSLEDIIQSLCIAYSILDLSLQKGGKQRS